MSPCTFVLMLIFCLFPCCNALQNEKCNYSVVIKQTAETFTCFREMGESASICTSGQRTPSCQIEYRQGVMCLKWLADIDLICVSDSHETLNGKIKCAHDQESISCRGEYQFEPIVSVSTLSTAAAAAAERCCKPLTTACVVMTFSHWMALNLFF